MKMRNFVLFAVASSTMAIYGEPIDLGCNARGPLAALNSSVAFRKAIGAGNPANYLSSISDVNGQQLSPGSSKALQCPLSIDSNALPSPSASKAILLAEARVRSHQLEQQPVAPGQASPILVSAAAGVVAAFPQPDNQKSETQVVPQAAPRAEAGGTPARRSAPVASDPGRQDQQFQTGSLEAKREWTLQPLAVPSPKKAEKKNEQSIPAAGSQENGVLSLAEAIGLIRQTRTANSVGLLEFDPVMVLFDFLGLFSAVLAFCLLVFHPGLRTAAVRSKADLYRAILRGDDLRAPEALQVAPRRSPPAQAQAPVISMGQFANTR